MRDPTRGGLTAAVYEIAESSGVTIEIEEAAILIRPEVLGACEMLGLDPLAVANEGRLVAVVAGGSADSALRSHLVGRDAGVIGCGVNRRERPLFFLGRA